MKDTTIILRIEPELKAHLEKVAQKHRKPLSEYIRLALKKASGYKEKPIV